MKLSWLDREVTLYENKLDITGRPATLRHILLSAFGRDMSTIVSLRRLDLQAKDYKRQKEQLKDKLQLFSPSALLNSRAAGHLEIQSKSRLMQLDFDHEEIKAFNIEELKQKVFSLPCVAFCGLSCSGKGFYCLIEIAEPERQNEYANHCFKVFGQKGLKPDTSKGALIQDLRYVSYDANMLIREYPVPLRILKFSKEKKPSRPFLKIRHNSNHVLADKQLHKIATAIDGERFNTVRKAAYTLGGLKQPTLLNEAMKRISSNKEFNGDEAVFKKVLVDCFRAGEKNPLDTKFMNLKAK